MRNSDWLDIILRIYDSPSAKQCEEWGIMSEKTYYNLFDCKGVGKPFDTEKGSSVLKREKIRAIYDGMSDIEIGYFEQSMKISSLKYASNTGGKSDLDEYAKALNKELIDLFKLPISPNAPFLTYFLWVSNVTKFYFALAYELVLKTSQAQLRKQFSESSLFQISQ